MFSFNINFNFRNSIFFFYFLVFYSNNLKKYPYSFYTKIEQTYYICLSFFANFLLALLLFSI